jgi:hypothetical protein
MTKMKTPNLLLLWFITLIALAGCRLNQAGPASITPQNAGEGFAIYLLAKDITPGQLPLLSHLELQPEPFLTNADILVYHLATHEIELTKSGYEKMHALKVPASGLACAVCVDRQPVYEGAFWADYSSISYDGIVINITRVIQGNPRIQIVLGYPGPDFFKGNDPRSDAGIFQALEAVGKLK